MDARQERHNWLTIVGFAGVIIALFGLITSLQNLNRRIEVLEYKSTQESKK